MKAPYLWHDHGSAITALSGRIEYWPQMARRAIATDQGTSLRVWLVLWNLTREIGGPGWFDLSGEGLSHLASFIGISPRRLRDTLHSGAGLFWRFDSRPGRFRIFLVSVHKINTALAARALDHEIADPEVDESRRCTMDINDLLGPLGRFYSECYAGWVSIHRDGEITLPYAVQGRIWGRRAAQIKRWAKRAGLHASENYARLDIGPAATYSPAPAVEETSGSEDRAPHITGPDPLSFHTWNTVQNGRVYRCWQRANTVHAGDKRRSSGTGQARANREHVSIASFDVSRSSARGYLYGFHGWRMPVDFAESLPTLPRTNHRHFKTFRNARKRASAYRPMYLLEGEYIRVGRRSGRVWHYSPHGDGARIEAI